MATIPQFTGAMPDDGSLARAIAELQAAILRGATGGGWTLPPVPVDALDGSEFVAIVKDDVQTWTTVADVASFSVSPPPGPPSPPGSPLRPKFFVAPANAYNTGTQGYLDGATYLSGSEASGKAGTFSLTTTSGNYGWVAIDATASAGGVRFSYSGGGDGGWSGAGHAGDYSSGATVDTSSVVVTDSATGTDRRLFRQDYENASPDPSTYTTS